MDSTTRLAVGIITCMRPKGLQKILTSIAAQDVPEGYSLSAIVVDNDLTGKNQDVVTQVTEKTGLPIIFVEEPVRGIPAARNASVQAALDHDFDAMIFVDDDEEAMTGWLTALLSMWRDTGADIITGPVLGVLPKGSPAWAEKSGIYEHTFALAAGTELEAAYTGNTLSSRKMLQDMGPSFSMEFLQTGSSDLHYFSAAHQKGYRILWCPAAVIREDVPQSRISLKWQLKRGFRIGTGNSINRIMQNPKIGSYLYAVATGLARIISGVIQLLLSPLTGWKHFIFGLKRTAVGAGNICGLFGINPKEYKTIHGA